MEALNSFVSCLKNSNRRVDHSLTNASTELIEKEQSIYISSIIRAIEYCGQQRIVLRSHRDDGQLFNDEKPNVNCGNFRELILLMCELDNNFKESILSSKISGNYLSRTTQNDLLLFIKEYIQYEIVKEIKNQPEGLFYSLSADEITDVSNWEQLGVILRYTEDCRPVEKLLEYVRCEDIKGTSIANYLIKTLRNAGLDVMMC